MPTPSLEQRVARLEAELAHLKPPTAEAEAELPWWEKIVGVFADDPYFEAAVARGREYRKSLGAIEAAADELSNLPEKPIQGYSLQEAIDTLRAPIETALSRRYTFDEIAQILTTEGIKLNGTELGQYYQVTPKKSQVRRYTQFV
jgi:hypothetical protein